MNIGILGCSKIAYTSIILPAKQIDAVRVHAIASRQHENAKDYASRFNIPVVYESYERLLNSNDVDAVYIALPNHLHKEMIVQSAQHKKHILVEKPICLTTQEFDEIRRVCEQNGVFLLEGLMISHHPWQGIVKEYSDKDVLGKLRTINSRISFIPRGDINNNYRSNPEHGGGCFYDLAPYWLQIVQALIGLEPISFEGYSVFDGPNRCDTDFFASLQFSDGVTSSFSASYKNPYGAQVEIIFERGRIILKNLFRANLGKHTMTLNLEKTTSDGHVHLREDIVLPAQNYYVNQLEFFAGVVAGEIPSLDISLSGERIYLLEQLYLDARKKGVGAP